LDAKREQFWNIVFAQLFMARMTGERFAGAVLGPNAVRHLRFRTTRRTEEVKTENRMKLS